MHIGDDASCAKLVYVPTRQQRDTNVALHLLEALIHENQAMIDAYLLDLFISRWINSKMELPAHLRDLLQRATLECDSITCLGFANFYNDAKIVRQLVAAGADVTGQDSHGRTPLHFACMSDKEADKKAEFLLACCQTLVNVADTHKNAPLHLAILQRNTRVINVLIEHDTSVNQVGKFGQTPLHVACSEGDVDVTHLLMGHGASVEAVDCSNGATALHLAAYFNHPEVVRVLIDDYNASVNERDIFGKTSLQKCVDQGHTGALLIDTLKPCDVKRRNHPTSTPPPETKEICRRLDCIRKLVDSGASVNDRDSDGVAPLHSAVRTGSVEVVKILASSQQCDIDIRERCSPYERTPLHEASEYGHVTCIHELIKHGANVEAVDGYSKSTPLILAAAFNHIECVKALVEDYGASINVTNSDGSSPLGRAAFVGNVDMIRTLTSYAQCDVNMIQAGKQRFIWLIKKVTCNAFMN